MMKRSLEMESGRPVSFVVLCYLGAGDGHSVHIFIDRDPIVSKSSTLDDNLLCCYSVQSLIIVPLLHNSTMIKLCLREIS